MSSIIKIMLVALTMLIAGCSGLDENDVLSLKDCQMMMKGFDENVGTGNIVSSSSDVMGAKLLKISGPYYNPDYVKSAQVWIFEFEGLEKVGKIRLRVSSSIEELPYVEGKFYDLGGADFRLSGVHSGELFDIDADLLKELPECS